MKRIQLILLVLILVFVTVGWWFLLIRPRNADIAAADLRVASLVSDRQSLRSQIDGLNRIKDSEVTYIFAIGEMETSVPQNPELDDFLEDVTFLASRAGVEISTLGASVPTPSAESSELFQIDISINAEGGFFEALGFLFGLEDLDRLIRIDAVALTPQSSVASGDDPGANEDGVTPRAQAGLVQIQLTGRLFTRTSVAVETPPVPTTTTTDVPSDATTTTTSTTAAPDGDN